MWNTATNVMPYGARNTRIQRACRTVKTDTILRSCRSCQRPYTLNMSIVLWNYARSVISGRQAKIFWRTTRWCVSNAWIRIMTGWTERSVRTADPLIILWNRQATNFVRTVSKTVAIILQTGDNLQTVIRHRFSSPYTLCHMLCCGKMWFWLRHRCKWEMWIMWQILLLQTQQVLCQMRGTCMPKTYWYRMWRRRQTWC